MCRFNLYKKKENTTMNKKNILLLSISLFLINKTMENKNFRFVLVKEEDLKNKWIWNGEYDKNLNKIYILKNILSSQSADTIIKYTENKNSIKAQLILPIENQEKEIKKGINNRCINIIKKNKNGDTSATRHRLNFRKKIN
jgi:hypothetical protein